MVRYKDDKGRLVEVLADYPLYHSDQKAYLVKDISSKESWIVLESDFKNSFKPFCSNLNTAQKLSLYFSLFIGRRDVYAKSFVNKDGKVQYFPSYTYGWKQLPPEQRTCHPLTDEVLKSHLRGESRIGLFPILQDDSCRLLVIDFDKKDWQEAVNALRQTCQDFQIQLNVEVSKSGNGAHVWFFFEESISCREARNFGKKILELAMQRSKKISFDSFDRFFPNQDILPKGGFGNLIALPLQGESYQSGLTVFVDETFMPYPDQWSYLVTVQRLSIKTVAEVTGYDALALETPTTTLTAELSNTLTFSKNQLTASTLYQLKKRASFSNPEYYLKLRMRQPTYQTPEQIYLFEEDDDFLRVPRGLLNQLKKDFSQLYIEDKRLDKPAIKVNFQGELHFEQEVALQLLLSQDAGILSAHTGFGKTVLGAALIAKLQKPTLILVHNKQLLQQWRERLQRFLVFDEPEAVRFTPTGRRKIIGHIGQYDSTKKWQSHLVDVAMIQSLTNKENIQEFLDDYGLVIVDECHHVSTLSFEKVISQFRGRFLYGLTAIPERKDGHDPIIQQRIGPILYESKEAQHAFTKHLHLNLTSFGKFDTAIAKSSSFTSLCDEIATDTNRNQLIVSDVLECLQANRKILLLSNRIEQLRQLKDLLQEQPSAPIFLVTGQTSKKEKQSLFQEMENLPKNQAFILLSTGKFIGEGFDMPRLDTLFLASPLSWKNNLIQYAGRIHRPFEHKERVDIYDYLDIHVPYLERMFQKRQAAYKKMGYQLLENQTEQTMFARFDYEKTFMKDLENSRASLVISTPYMDCQLFYQLAPLLHGKAVIIYCPRTKHEWLAAVDGIAVHFLAQTPSMTVVISDKVPFGMAVSIPFQNTNLTKTQRFYA